jgi:hypothetical protein
MPHPALEFLNFLDPSPVARFNIETYTDSKRRPQPDPFTHRFATKSFQDVEALLPQLQSLNTRGAAIYVAVNEFNGQRKLGNLKRMRGVHADLDDVSDAQLRKLAGLTMTGCADEEVIVFCVGTGANGKSIFGNIMTSIMGAHAVTAPPSLLAARRSDDHGPRSDLAMLHGARLVSINELRDTARSPKVRHPQRVQFD